MMGFSQLIEENREQICTPKPIGLPISIPLIKLIILRYRSFESTL
jgi:hypothetical protein